MKCYLPTSLASKICEACALNRRNWCYLAIMVALPRKERNCCGKSSILNQPCSSQSIHVILINLAIINQMELCSPLCRPSDSQIGKFYQKTNHIHSLRNITQLKLIASVSSRILEQEIGDILKIFS